MSSGEVVLYDIARRGGNSSWSGNVWKTRLALNYKRIPYTTTWLSHPEVEATVKQLGIPPNASGLLGTRYTVPVVRLPNGEHIMESAAIAERLEKVYPEPSLHLDTGLHNTAAAAVGKTGFALLPVFMPRVVRTMIVESSVPWVREARQKAFGMSLEELEAAKGGERAWEAAKPGFVELRNLISDHKRDEGPFILGSVVSYADFVVVAALEGFQRIGRDIFDRLVSEVDGLAALHEACSQWTKDDK
ncbi:hypothetical protein LTS10_005977 [Elasticomyces elasticus]|nr:hypothetical protein LTS10_005977 [Elasticomyces elasticus]